MLALEERFMIRELYRKGVSISEIARRTGRDRKTIRQIATAPGLSPAKPTHQAKVCKIDPYAPYLEKRMAEGVLNARIMRDKLRKVNPPAKQPRPFGVAPDGYNAALDLSHYSPTGRKRG
jgi:transposase